VKVWSGRVAQEYDSLRVFDCPVYYYVRRQVGPEGKKKGVRRIQERRKMLQNLRSKGQEVYLKQRCHV